ncbi:MAG TPA: hypothetical protein VGK38_07820, partial [Prolixibacteraceae bacterium]
MKKILLNTVLYGFLLLPLILWFLWVFKPSYKANILIIDKTVLTKDGLEHKPFDWVLHHRKYFKPDGKSYTAQSDYLGFFPLKNDSFLIKDLSKFTEKQIDSISSA